MQRLVNASSGSSVADHAVVEQAVVERAVVEQAKGALMFRYGIGSHESLAVLDRWAREAGTSLPEVAVALVHGICLGRVTAETQVTVRWLEQRLRGDVSDVRGGVAGAGARAGAAVAAGAAAGVEAGVAEGLAEGLAPGEGTEGPTVPAPARSAAGARQWRYSSALHAARVQRSR